MKLLVVEDNQTHQQAAKDQLANHEVVIIGSFTEFMKQVNGYSTRSGWQKATLNLSEFDAILTDINLPSSNDTEKYTEKEAATGFIVAMAALRAGVKMVGIITDANHHEDHISKGMDMFLGQDKLFSVGDTAICLTNSDIFYQDGAAKKNWGNILSFLTAESKPFSFF